MSTINELISRFKEIADNPKKAMDDYRAETGKGAVGIMPVYCPEEIVHATGYLPIGMWGAQGKNISKARALLPPFACSIMQSSMELQLSGVYDELSAVIFSVPCDTLKCMSQKWKGKAPKIVFTHPQNRKAAQSAANVFCREEYLHVKEELEDILGVQITNKDREFSDLVAENPGLIRLRDRHAVIKARWFMEKSRHTALLKELNDAIRSAEKVPFNGKRVIVSGITLEPYEVLDIFEEFGFAIVADDLAHETRNFRQDVPQDEDPLMALARAWNLFDGCSLATDADKPKGRILIDAVNKYKADAVIICMMKFCDPEEFDYPILLDQETTSFEQIRTRIQTFSEVI